MEVVCRPPRTLGARHTKCTPGACYCMTIQHTFGGQLHREPRLGWIWAPVLPCCIARSTSKRPMATVER